jgi:hypothetical protein
MLRRVERPAIPAIPETGSAALLGLADRVSQSEAGPKIRAVVGGQDVGRFQDRPVDVPFNGRLCTKTSAS